mgnify:CR=1 FL=1
MSYKFVKVNLLYSAYLADYYFRYPRVTEGSYAEQLSHLMSDRFGWADLLSSGLGRLGVDAQEIVFNAPALQNAWAIEHGSRNSRHRLLIQQLKAIQPDVVLWDSFPIHDGEFIDHVKTEVRSIRQNIGYWGGPFSLDHVRQFKSFDYMLSCSPGFVSTFEMHGIPSHHFNHAFEPRILGELNLNNTYPISDLFFSGSLMIGPQHHNQRIKVIEKLLADNVDVQVHASLLREGLFRLSLKRGLFLTTLALKSLGLEKLFGRIPEIERAAQWSEWPKRRKYPKPVERTTQSPLFGIEMLKALSRAKISFNSHIDAAGKYAANMRLFEATGAGTCLVTDWKENLHELFELDKEVVTYRSGEECVEKVEWLLNHPRERESIAMAGQRRTLGEHTYDKRAGQLDDIINMEFLSGAGSS